MTTVLQRKQAALARRIKERGSDDPFAKLLKKQLEIETSGLPQSAKATFLLGGWQHKK